MPSRSHLLLVIVDSSGAEDPLAQYDMETKKKKPRLCRRFGIWVSLHASIEKWLRVEEFHLLSSHAPCSCVNFSLSYFEVFSYVHDKTACVTAVE